MNFDKKKTTIAILSNQEKELVSVFSIKERTRFSLLLFRNGNLHLRGYFCSYAGFLHLRQFKGNWK